MKTRFMRPLGALAFGLLTASLAQAAPYYVASVNTTELPTLGHTDTGADDINNSGFIVGWAKNPATMRRRAVLWKGIAPPLDLGTTTASMFSYASGINDANEVVGTYGDPDEFNWQAFYWSTGLGVVTLNRSLYPGTTFDSKYVAQAYAINKLGVIVGRVESRGLSELIPHEPCYRSLPVRWKTPFAMPQIVHCPELVDGPNSAGDINDLGTIVGTETDEGRTWNAFQSKGGVLTHLPPPIFGTEPAAGGINESGMVVGSAKFFGSSYIAMRWDGTSASSAWIGTLPGGSASGAADVNDQGFVSGTSDMRINPGVVPEVIRKRGYVWHPDFGLFALPVPAGMAPLTTDCSAKALTNRAVLTQFIDVVGNCGGRAVRWRMRVGIAPVIS